MSDAVKAGAQVTKSPRWQLVYLIDAEFFSVLFLLASVIFSNGISGDFTFDDHLAIEKNADAWSNKTTFRSIFFNDFWGKPLDRVESNRSYRPITVLTFRLQHWLMGYQHNPAFLHIVNYIIAYINVCLLFYLARLYVYVAVPVSALDLESAKSRSLTSVLTSPLHAVPLMAALLYLVHPVHVDAVTSIVGRCELLYCFFGLIGFFCIHRYLNPSDEENNEASATTRCSDTPLKVQTVSIKAAPKRSERRARKQPMSISRHIPLSRFLFLSACALVISILCKDSAITFTALYSVHACVMYVCRRCSGLRSLVVIGIAVLELLSYLLFRRLFVGNVGLERNPLLRRTENPQYFVPKGIFHWFSIRWVIQVKNAELLFFPTSLCCEYSFNCVPHMYDMQDPRVPSFIMITGAVLATVLGCIYATFVFRSRVALVGLLGILWVAIPYAPVSHLFVAVGTFIAERCLYVPSIGAVLLITFLVGTPGLRVGVVPLYFYGLIFLCIGWGIFSHRRNMDWLSDEQLFRAAVRTCPTSGKAHSQLAALVANREQRTTPEIVELAQRSIELDSSLRDGYFYLAANEVNNHHNMEKAYHYLRLCVEDPFSLHSCHASYNVVRSHLFPNMTEVDRLLDDASLTTLSSQKAIYLRQAGLITLQSSNNSCRAEELFERALNHWNSSQMFWLSDEVGRMSDEHTYCNALYWFELSSLSCETQRMATKAMAPNLGNTGDDSGDKVDSSDGVSLKDLPLTPQEAAQRAVAVEKRLRPCETNWHQVLSEPKYNLPTIPYRMSQYIIIADRTREVLNHYARYTRKDTPERHEVVLASLDVQVRLFCHFHTITQDGFVRHRLNDRFRENLQSLEEGFRAIRSTRLSEIRAALRELRMATRINSTQQDTLKNIVATASCSSDLSFVEL